MGGVRSRIKAIGKWQATDRSRLEREMLDLAFNVDLAESFALSDFEDIARLAGEDAKPIVSLLEQMLPVVIENELCGIVVRFESKLLSNES